ncbi:MAG TPA: NAD(+)--rifampin ADP-ribosyltransferase [Gaiellaceae bacterium]|nr:NAD(+)--rifampin ADP-ribosyltransferase [Gaiellaceae bacterium]
MSHPVLELRVNFGVFADREATAAEIDALAKELLANVDHVSIISERHHEIGLGAKSAVPEERTRPGRFGGLLSGASAASSMRRRRLEGSPNATASEKLAATMPAACKLYHGGVSGLAPGQALYPPSLTGTRSCADFDTAHCRSDRVYLTTDQADAAVYAALAPLGGRGDVYEVEPLGALEPHPPGGLCTSSYAAPAATVVAVVRRGTSLDEAAASIAAFMLELAAANAAGVSRTGPLRSSLRGLGLVPSEEHPVVPDIADALPH